MIYSVYEIKERRNGLPPAPTAFIAKTQTLVDARKKASELVWKEHVAQVRRGTNTPIRKGIFSENGYLGKVVWCTKCERILWNKDNTWYGVAYDGRLEGKV